MKDFPRFHEHDASISLWLDDPKDPMVRKARDEVVRLLRSLGWRVQLDPHTKKHYPAISKDHHHAQRGDLQAQIEASGRCMKVEFFQDLVHENRNGGRYDFHKRQKMPYLIGLQYEATVRKVAACIEGLGLPKLKRDVKLTGQAFIDRRRAELLAFQGPRFYDPDQCPAYNCTAADKTRLRDGQRVWLIAEWNPTGRWMSGVACRNINNMWWVLLPGGEVRNEAGFRLHTTPPADPRGRHFDAAARIKKLQRLEDAAAKAKQFERADKLRDAIKAISLEGSAACPP